MGAELTGYVLAPRCAGIGGIGLLVALLGAAVACGGDDSGQTAATDDVGRL